MAAVDLAPLQGAPFHNTDSAEISTEPERYNYMDMFPIYAPIFIVKNFLKYIFP